MTSIRLYPELWQAIFDQLDYEPGKKADLQAVSKASHLFHELAEPLLFASILLVSGYSEIDAQTIALIRSLSSRMATQQWVRSVRMIGKRLGSGESIQPIADIFVQLDNLRNIRINGMNITDGMVQHLLHLPHPFSFECRNITCTTEAVNVASDTRGLQMTSLIVEDIGRTSTIPLIKHLASGPHLSVLCLSRSVSQEFYQTPLQNLDHCFDSLRHLQVYQPIKQTEVENFLDFLASCPFLSHLKIIPQVAWVPSGSLSTSVPHLSSFDGLYSLAISFVAGRPLTSLSLRWMRGENLSKESLSKLAEGSVPLRRLSMVNVTWYNDALLDIAEYFPALQSLKLYAISKYSINWMRERLASDIQSLLELHELVISSVPTMGSQVGDLVLDHMTLKALRSANDRSVLLRL